MSTNDGSNQQLDSDINLDLDEVTNAKKQLNVLLEDVINTQNDYYLKLSEYHKFSEMVKSKKEILKLKETKYKTLASEIEPDLENVKNAYELQVLLTFVTYNKFDYRLKVSEYGKFQKMVKSKRVKLGLEEKPKKLKRLASDLKSDLDEVTDAYGLIKLVDDVNNNRYKYMLKLSEYNTFDWMIHVKIRKLGLKNVPVKLYEEIEKKHKEINLIREYVKENTPKNAMSMNI